MIGIEKLLIFVEVLLPFEIIRLSDLIRSKEPAG